MAESEITWIASEETVRHVLQLALRLGTDEDFRSSFATAPEVAIRTQGMDFDVVLEPIQLSEIGPVGGLLGAMFAGSMHDSIRDQAEKIEDAMESLNLGLASDHFAQWDIRERYTFTELLPFVLGHGPMGPTGPSDLPGGNVLAILANAVAIANAHQVTNVFTWANLFVFANAAVYTNSSGIGSEQFGQYVHVQVHLPTGWEELSVVQQLVESGVSPLRLHAMVTTAVSATLQVSGSSDGFPTQVTAQVQHGTQTLEVSGVATSQSQVFVSTIKDLQS